MNSVTDIFVKAIDLLQGENRCYLGYLLPTLLGITHKLEQLTNLEFGDPLSDALKSGVYKRFPFIINLTSDEAKPFVLSTITIPKFKLKWIPILEKKNLKTFKEWLVEETKEGEEQFVKDSVLTNDSEEFYTSTSALKSREEKDFENCKFELDVLAYFNDTDKNLTSLQNYKRILHVFLKFNSVLPSSAPVERLFSCGGQVLTPKRNRLGDEIFETLVMLKKHEY
ncbi:uncharacterized protein LOC128265852 [Drosophila gunungcola]|uniref:uncharacterized protein LOC128265852 n=1 Tax=Drosophila gunungcola TaxID=103775 RepID=UPI0022DF3D74|nr:uncharacterized protein LOC128265852 [Drosophila gunungcola]